MSTPATVTAAPLPGDQIRGRCYRCGNPTRSPEVGLCETCNPSALAGPTATQVHGLILAAVAGALIAIGLAAKLLAAPEGPFPATVGGQAAYPDGTVEVVVTIANSGSAAARPTCTIVRGSQDVGSDFLSDPVPAGGSITVTKRVAPLTVGPPYALVQVTCR